MAVTASGPVRIEARDPAARSPAGLQGWLALLLGTLLLAAVALHAWATWKRDLLPLTPPGVAEGGLVSMILINGQVYYGTVVAANASRITIDNVYYVQTDVDAATNQRNNRLVSRQRTDWHAPARMTIAADKIVMIEEVGAGSRLQMLMEQDRASAQPPRPPVAR